MKKLFLLGCLAVLSMIMAVPGQAVASLTIGTTTGSGSAGTNGTSYTYSGSFAFDNITTYPTQQYGPQTLKAIVGDQGQFSVAINSSGVPVFDFNGWTPGVPAIPVAGQYTWALNNQGGAGGTSLYGSVVNWGFAPAGGTQAFGTVNGTLKSDGFFHWYYGYDSTVGPPAGKTSLASMGLSDTFNFTGKYMITGGENSSNITYNLTGTVSAAPVPVPAAVWLLGTGLVGLFGVRRRFTKS